MGMVVLSRSVASGFITMPGSVSCERRGIPLVIIESKRNDSLW